MKMKIKPTKTFCKHHNRYANNHMVFYRTEEKCFFVFIGFLCFVFFLFLLLHFAVLWGLSQDIYNVSSERRYLILTKSCNFIPDVSFSDIKNLHMNYTNTQKKMNVLYDYYSRERHLSLSQSYVNIINFYEQKILPNLKDELEQKQKLWEPCFNENKNKFKEAFKSSQSFVRKFLITEIVVFIAALFYVIINYENFFVLHRAEFVAAIAFGSGGYWLLFKLISLCNNVDKFEVQLYSVFFLIIQIDNETEEVAKV